MITIVDYGDFVVTRGMKFPTVEEAQSALNRLYPGDSRPIVVRKTTVAKEFWDPIDFHQRGQ